MPSVLFKSNTCLFYALDKREKKIKTWGQRGGDINLSSVNVAELIICTIILRIRKDKVHCLHAQEIPYHGDIFFCTFAFITA